MFASSPFFFLFNAYLQPVHANYNSTNNTRKLEEGPAPIPENETCSKHNESWLDPLFEAVIRLSREGGERTSLNLEGVGIYESGWKLERADFGG